MRYCARVDWVSVIGGFVLLVGGGEALVRGASGIALSARLTPAVVGLTVVAAGTSMPEFVVSIQAAIEGSPGLAVGNIVGSTIFNIGLILGLTALILPLRILGNTVRLEWPVLVIAGGIFHVFGRDMSIDRLEGAFLLTGLIAFMAYSVWIARKNISPVEQEEFSNLATASFGRSGWAAVALNATAILLGMGLLAVGSAVLVHGATGIAAAFGISDAVVGLTVVAAGTSSPELVTSVVAARRGRDDIAVANVIGSSIYNILGIGGATAILHPLPVPADMLRRDNWWMIAATLVLLPLMKSSLRVSRAEGGLLLAAFVTYLVLLITSV